MIGKKLEKKMNEQIVHELYSAYIYLAMSAYFESIGMKGAAHWMRCQAQEEEIHAMKFFMHIVDRGGRVELGQIDQPAKEWKSPLDAFEVAYKHEQKITGLINDLVALAAAEKDFASNTLLQWFTNEQIEEEAQTSDIVNQLKLIEGNKAALLLLDKELATRVFTYPANVNINANNQGGGA